MYSNLQVTRRELLKLSGVATIGAALWSLSPSLGFLSQAQAAQTTSTGDGEEVLLRLMNGNKLYMAGKSRHPHQTLARRQEVTNGQKPFAVILGCSDSRVPPEILFDQGLGDLFVVRVAGNVVDNVVEGSIEYAVEELGVPPLIMVLGHEKCGAVTAAVDVVKKGGQLPGEIDTIVNAIKPAVERVKGNPGDLVENAIDANVLMVVEKLKASQPIIAKFVEKGQLKVSGAKYELKSGVVRILV
jgi:carbonic anhydrase